MDSCIRACKAYADAFPVCLACALACALTDHFRRCAQEIAPTMPRTRMAGVSAMA
jgi:hypothetical protein